MRLTKIVTASLIGSMSAYSWAIEPQSINLRGFEFTPTLLVYQSYDDNYRGLRENTFSSQITGIEPTLTLSAEDRNSAYELQYSFNADYYHDDSNATNADHHLTLKSALVPTDRHRFRWNLGYHRIEDTINDIPPDIDLETLSKDDFRNDKYSRALAGLGYTFGARTALNQLEFGADYEQRRYRNSGGINEDQDRDSLMLSTAWFHRIGARTRSIVELRHAEHDYRQDQSNRDGSNTAALAGATWEATARTTGTVRLGAERKDFDSSERSSYTSPMWEAGVTYMPRSYSAIKLNSRRKFDEGEDAASTIQDVTTLLTWEHEWNYRISTELLFQYSDRDYKASAREDELVAYGIGVTYALDRWADVTLGYRRSENDSTFRNNSYDRNVYLLSLNLSL